MSRINFITDIAVTDYYPFDYPMPGRYSNPDNYRFGFNGKENDNEVKGIGNQQDYGMRIYDTRLGRFLSVDPLTSKFPFYTPYQFAGNTPIVAIDLDGCEDVWVTQFSTIQNGNTYTGEPQTHIDVMNTTYRNELLQMAKKVGFDKVPKTGDLITQFTYDFDKNELNWNYTYNRTPEIKEPTTYEEVVDGIRDAGKIFSDLGDAVATLGVMSIVTPGVEAAPVLLYAGMTMSIMGEATQILADVLDGNVADAAVRTLGVTFSYGVGKKIQIFVPEENYQQVSEFLSDKVIGQLEDWSIENNDGNNSSSTNYSTGSGTTVIEE